MKKLFILLIVLSMGFNGIAQETEKSKEFEANVEVKVYNLKNTYLSNAYFDVVRNIVYTDYDRKKSSVNYDKKSNVLIVTATPLTQQKVERFLNKIDVPADFLSFKVYILKTTEKSGFEKGIDKDIIKELQEINVNGATIISTAKIITTSGKEASVTKNASSGDGFEVIFVPTGNKNNLIVDLELNKLTKENNPSDNSVVYNRYKMLSSAFPISYTKPVIVGMTYEDDSSAILALKLLK